MRKHDPNQGSLLGYVDSEGAPLPHPALCACAACASPVEVFKGETPTATEGALLGLFYSSYQVEKFTNSFDGVEAVLTPLADGRFSVRLRDIDADAFIPCVYQFTDIEAAREKARKIGEY